MKIDLATGSPIISFPPEHLRQAEARAPEGDFVDRRFDSVSARTSELVLLLSTPRSGSTFLCDLFRMRAGFVAHEYFNPNSNLPILADRWGCLDSRGVLDVGAYVAALRRYRTGSSGVLGINVQGSQLPLFETFMPLLGDLQLRVVRLDREDRIAQAISFVIADQTKQWTRQHTSRSQPRYDFRAINRRIEGLARETAKLDAFVHKHGMDVHRIRYEALVAAPVETVNELLEGIPLTDEGVPAVIGKQGNNLNSEWKRRYIDDSLRLSEGFAQPRGNIIRRGFRRLDRQSRRLRARLQTAASGRATADSGPAGPTRQERGPDATRAGAVK